MAKFVGTVRRSDLEGGSFMLVTKEGTVYQLKGGGPELRVDGLQVEVKGHIAKGTVGLAMMGEVLEVHDYRRLP